MEDFFLLLLLKLFWSTALNLLPPFFYLCNKALYVKFCDLLSSFALWEYLSADDKFELRSYPVHFLVAVLIGQDFSELEFFFFFFFLAHNCWISELLIYLSVASRVQFFFAKLMKVRVCVAFPKTSNPKLSLCNYGVIEFSVLTWKLSGPL